MLCDELGTLLTTISNATATVFGDNAHVTHVIPSPNYDTYGTILDITVSIMKKNYDDDEYKARLEIFDNLIYNPVINSDWILTKVDIVVVTIE